MHESLKQLIELARTLATILKENFGTVKDTVTKMEELVQKAGGAQEIVVQLRSDVTSVAVSYDEILAELTAGDLTSEQEKEVLDKFKAANERLAGLAKGPQV